MDLEHLTKTQIILLTLLVSFVTSIATGIVTVTLLAQTPPAVTQTINRVVERTVERVVPPEEDEQVAAAVAPEVITREVQVVVKESELIAEAVAKVNKSVVRLGPLGSELSDATNIGFFVARTGLIATDGSSAQDGRVYTVRTAEGIVLEARVKSKSEDGAIALLEISGGAEAGTVFPPVALSDLNALALGESVVAISGKERTVIAAGIVTDLERAEGVQGATSTAPIKKIATDIRNPAALPGSPLIDTSGEVIGMYVRGIPGADLTFQSLLGIAGNVETESAPETTAP